MFRRKQTETARITPIGEVMAVGVRAGDQTTRLTKAEQARIEPGFPKVDGPHYLDVLGALHDVIKPDLYLEIGTQNGRSLARCKSDFVAIDPEFQLSNLSFGKMRKGYFQQTTSDDFFASGFAERNGMTFDLGFLDGMHLAEFLLRDFMNFERLAKPGATAVLHDCLPSNTLMENREWDREVTRQWTGDVWKVVALLLEKRPDLKVDVLDAYPTGLVVVRGLDPNNGVLREEYESFERQMTQVRLTDFGIDRYFSLFQIRSCHDFLAELGRL